VFSSDPTFVRISSRRRRRISIRRSLTLFVLGGPPRAVPRMF
jgi:hypothetical protein